MSSAAYEDTIAAGTRPRSRLKPVLLVAGGLVLLVCAGLYGREWWTTGRFVETTDDAYVGGNVTPIAPHVAGFIQTILVADNAAVHAGEVLIRIDPRDAEAALAHARAVLTARDAAADSFRAQSALQQAVIRQSEADVVAKGAQAAFAEQDARRYADLAVTAAGSRQDAQRSASLDREARATVTFAVAGLQAAREKLTVLQSQIAEADAAVAQARADMQTARLDLDYTEIRSPIDGTVGNRAAQVGGYVKAGTYLISITPAKGLWVEANYKEDQLTHMAPGQPAEVTADVLPGHEFHGHVASFTPGTGAVFSIIPPENATGNFTKIVQRVPVRVVLDADDSALSMLRPGLSTTVSVNVKAAAK
ncbi:HlyD family secretion protein [Rhodopila sp.]|uniref:HlyD family secretion protein n=1 Tax=Rhodopila sp. TaxID=2480087 RepID=UPI003D0C8692